MDSENEGLPKRPLIGKTAVVTGGGRGIGASIATLLARAGAQVALVGRSEASLRAVAEKLPNNAEIIVADLSQPDAPAEVINNAAGENFTASHELTAQEIDELWALNGRAPLILGGKIAAHMASIGGGSIVNISSVIGSERSIANQSLYAATKGGVDAITRSLAAEWGRKGVRVNAVRPAVTRSDMSATIFADPEIEKLLSAQYALGRLGEPEDIAQAVLFFATEASSYITGQTLSVDGGWISALVH
jgi:NAD(P)-dependent dehydrogenase (short-subunit alcohol dehydrogenase family)